MKVKTERGFCLYRGIFLLKVFSEKNMKTFHSTKLFNMDKKFLISKNQTFLTLGHHHPKDDLVSQMFGFYFSIFQLIFIKPKQTLWTVNSILGSVSP